MNEAPGYNEAQRKYDRELAASMRQMSVRVASRSQKIAITLNAGADRLDALAMQVPINQPASTSAQT